MAFIGLGSCADLKSELKYYSGQTDTEDDIRRGMVQIMKLGLAPFVARTPIAKVMEMGLGRWVSSTAVDDPWDFSGLQREPARPVERRKIDENQSIERQSFHQPRDAGIEAQAGIFRQQGGKQVRLRGHAADRARRTKRCSTASTSRASANTGRSADTSTSIPRPTAISPMGTPFCRPSNSTSSPTPSRRGGNSGSTTGSATAIISTTMNRFTTGCRMGISIRP